MNKMDAYRARIVAKNAGGVKFLMKKNKIDVLFGHGRLAGERKVSVTDKDGKISTFGAKFVILATGSAVRHVDFIKMDHERIIDSDDLLQMKDKPEHLVVLGAGAVGSEFASVFLRYGSKVTLVEMQDRILPIEDDEVSQEVAKVFTRQGMKVMTGAKLTKAERVADGVKLVIEHGGKAVDVQASHLLVAIGRRPVTEDVGLDVGKVKVDQRGFVEVDQFMRTSQPWVYAIGDIVNTPWLAHVASKEGILAVEHMKGHNPRPLNYDHVPNCTYCAPEVASVGLTEREAKKRGYEVKVGKFPFSAIGKANILGKPDGFIKIVASAKYDELLGVHIVGPKATELISEATLALEVEATVEELLHTIHPHPTLAEAMGEAAHAVVGETIHI
jgi:dihydrolipoamide dehydrogenase